jgi:cyclopropane fatty-acyl-phospholipid synthase-like methyltransferase
MKLPAMRHWFGMEPTPKVTARAPAARPTAAIRPPEPSEAVLEDCPWPAERQEVVDALWGEGFQFPGGEAETLRLVKPLGLSAATSLLLVGAGSGGPPCSIASDLGVWVTGYESDHELLNAATDRSLRSGLSRRAQIASWDPESPSFERGYFHHGLALEPLRDALVEPALTAVAQALKPGGHLVMLQTVADTPLDPEDPLVAAWQQLDGCRLDRLPAEVTITRALGRLGFDVRIVEDLSRRHMQQSVAGWREAVRGMEQAKPNHREAAQLIREAELWLLRIRLFRSRALRLVRWHAIGTL